ncbi:MAG: hypothetical protein FJ333_09970, partial [Sphingomonadales bacterium]|nr:hypothetical protein [Sphingomonadales bacterium]
MSLVECEINRELLLISGNVERNPGPDFMVITQNCRGLNNPKKLNPLIKKCHKKTENSKWGLIFLQETHLTSDKQVRLKGWDGEILRSNAVTRNSAGCLTLLTKEINVHECVLLGERGHLAVIGHPSETGKILIANIYAPIRDQSNKQLKFYADLNEELALLKGRWSVEHSIIAGDFNLDMAMPMDERSTLPKITRLTYLQLDDIVRTNRLSFFSDDITYQNRGQQHFSRLDFILFNKTANVDYEQSVDWTLTKSDHCAVILQTKRKKSGNIIKAPRISPEWLNNAEITEAVRYRLRDATETIPNHWNPHMKLEFLKTMLRGALQDEIKRFRKKWNEELDEVGKGIRDVLREAPDIDDEQLTALDSLFAKRDAILETKGDWLANKTRQINYNEGEKGTKTFLSSMRAQNKKCNLDKIKNEEGALLNTSSEVASTIQSFYNQLYNQTFTPCLESASKLTEGAKPCSNT